MVVVFADLTFGMVMAHIFTADPKWLAATSRADALVLFDGECAMCNRAVQFLMKRDKQNVLRFAPLKGSTAEAIGQRHKLDLASLQTMVLVEGYNGDGERLFFRSSAFFRILRQFGGVWKILALLRFVPRVVTDAVYNLIARNRYAISRQTTCQLFPAAAAERVLP